MNRLIKLIEEAQKKITQVQEVLFVTPHINIHLKKGCLYKADASILTIEDCYYAFTEFLEGTESHNNLYLNAYGILQMLYTQSDAIHSLYNSATQEYKHSKAMENIRESRNLSIGHPTNYKSSGKKCTSIISRPTMQNESFEFLISYENGESDHIPCNLIELIEIQINELKKLTSVLLDSIYKKTKKKLSHLRVDFFRSRFDELKINHNIKRTLGGDISSVLEIEEVIKSLKIFRGDLKKNYFLSDSMNVSITKLCELLDSCIYNEGADEDTITAINHDLICIEEMILEIEEKIEVIKSN